MPGKKSRERKFEYAPSSLVRHIDTKMKEMHAETRVEAMEELARELDNIIIKKRRTI